MKAYYFSISCNDGIGEDPHQKYSHTIKANSEQEANAIIDEEFKNRKMYEKSISKVYDLDLFISKIIEGINEVNDFARYFQCAVPTPIASLVGNLLKTKGYRVPSCRWTGANTNITVEFFPRKVLRTQIFHPEAFEGNLDKAITDALPNNVEYMYLNGVVWFVESKKDKRVAVDTGLRYKDIIQDVVENRALNNIKALME